MELTDVRLPDSLRAEVDVIVDSPKAVHGWCDVNKAHTLAALVVRERPETLVELGVYRGRSALVLALAIRHNAIPGSFVAAVDSWTRQAVLEGDQIKDYPNTWQESEIEETRVEFLRHLDEYGLRDWVRVERKTSQDYAPEIADDSIDFLHIDGNHSELCSVRDVRLYLPKIKPGGWLCMDDAHWAEMSASVGLAKTHCDMVLDANHWILLRKKVK